MWKPSFRSTRVLPIVALLAAWAFLPGRDLADGRAAAAENDAATTRVAGDPVGAERPAEPGRLGIVVFGAHPDDAEIRAGGVGALWAAQGHDVQMVSVTNGDIGHFAMSGGALAQRRTAEVEKASEILGTTATVLDIHDGELEPTLENRRKLTRIIRRWKADIVIGHRPNDYHPDHRYVGVLMQDCAYMVGVPFFCPDVPPLKRNPLFLFSYDRFQHPTPFRGDIVVAIDEVIDKKVEALVGMESQFVEGGALGQPNPALEDPVEREKKRDEVRANFRRRFAAIADRYRDRLIERYGQERGSQVRYAEAFEICEYGRQPTAQEIRERFPFFPD